MTARPIVGVAVLSALLASAASSSAQSLGDVARKQAERRGPPPAAGKTFTNDNLTPDFTKPEPPPVAATEPAKPAEGAVEGKADGAKGEPTGESVVDVASDPAEAAKWGVTPRDQQTSSQSDDQNESTGARQLRRSRPGSRRRKSESPNCAPPSPPRRRVPRGASARSWNGPSRRHRPARSTPIRIGYGSRNVPGSAASPSTGFGKWAPAKQKQRHNPDGTGSWRTRPREVLSSDVTMRRHHEAASAAAVLWVLAGVPAAIAWTQAVIQKITKRPR